jgi:hypothetical protein
MGRYLSMLAAVAAILGTFPATPAQARTETTVRCVLKCENGRCHRVCRPIRRPPSLPALSR